MEVEREREGKGNPISVGQVLRKTSFTGKKSTAEIFSSLQIPHFNTIRQTVSTFKKKKKRDKKKIRKLKIQIFFHII